MFWAVFATVFGIGLGWTVINEGLIVDDGFDWPILAFLAVCVALVLWTAVDLWQRVLKS